MGPGCRNGPTTPSVTLVWEDRVEGDPDLLLGRVLRFGLGAPRDRRSHGRDGGLSSVVVHPGDLRS